jgi:hypothetical protein
MECALEQINAGTYFVENYADLCPDCRFEEIERYNQLKIKLKKASRGIAV